MNISTKQIEAVKQQLHDQISAYEKQLSELNAKQKKITNVEELAQSLIAYQELQHQISDRAHVYSVLLAPQQSLRSPFIKSDLFTYFVAAETIGRDIVHLLADDFHQQLKHDIEEGNDATPDEIEGEYKELLIPGKMMAEKFDEIDALLEEMIAYCQRLEKHYNTSHAFDVLRYAFIAAIDADTHMEPIVEALQKREFRYLHPEDRAALLLRVEERLGALRFEHAKNQNLLMNQAVHLLEQREAQII